MHHVLIDELFPPYLLGAIDQNEYQLHVWRDDQKFAAEILPNIEAALLHGHFKVDGALLDRLPKVRIIVCFGRGTDHIKHEDARKRGIPVASLPANILDETVADMAMGLMLAVARNIVTGYRYAKGPDFTAFDPSLFVGSNVTGKTLGIVGMGNVGYQVARRGHFGFDMPVLYFSRHRKPEADGIGAIYAPLSDLLTRSDFVVLTLPISESTRLMIGEPEIALMKPTAYLINVGRGGTVNHDALTKALIARRIAGAALDVTDPEPLPRDHPLLALDNLVITPHISSATIETRSRMGQIAAEHLKAGLRGESLLHQLV
ncbi:MAG: D-glycerate dehydrogenase [bacterium]|nr:D-glycerate dehydrogenase [bacterium]